MQSSTITIAAVFAFIAVGLTAGYPSVLTNSAINNDNAGPESRNVFQQFVINQIVNALPVNVRGKINDAAATFSMTRNDFLIRCLKELQAFQDYSKIDFITAIKKTVKFIDEQVTDEDKEVLEAIEPLGLQLATLIFTNQIKAGELNKLYDLEVKIVRQKIDGQTFVQEAAIIVAEIVSQHV